MTFVLGASGSYTVLLSYAPDTSDCGNLSPRTSVRARVFECARTPISRLMHGVFGSLMQTGVKEYTPCDWVPWDVELFA